MSPDLLIVVPCYNEQEILNTSSDKLCAFLADLIANKFVSERSRICLVDDGSRDKTWGIIEALEKHNPLIKSIKLAKNFGHQAAVLSGLLEFQNDFDVFITIDADLQDDMQVMQEMLTKHKEGAKVVYGVRNDRSSDSFFKKFTAESFYKIMLKMGVPVIFNHADYRLMDRKIIHELGNYKEVNLFLRGIIPTIGFKSEQVFYKRLEREAGESKYPLSKMLSFAWNGITSFSTKPMRWVLWFGIFNFLLALGITIYVIISKLSGNTVMGWASTLLPMAYFSGSNMIAIGLIGEYLGKVYEEIKARPRYIVEHKSKIN